MTQPMNGQAGPMLVDSQLQPVWFRPDCVTGCGNQDIWSQDFGEQTYQGGPVLMWWQGALSPVGVTESGADYVVNEHYRTVATLQGIRRLDHRLARHGDQRATTPGSR